MTATQLAFLLMIGALSTVTCIAITAIGRAHALRKKCDEWREASQHWEDICLKQSLAQGARLTKLSRDGRVMIWTFTRDGKEYTIETYAQMGDDYHQIRKDLGVE